MTPPVFLVNRAALDGDVVVVTGAEGRHAATVRRLRPGERVDVTDGCGAVAECVVTAVDKGRLEARVQARRRVPAPQPRVVVVQAVPKGDRAELAVATMTEVGVDVIVPWPAERCVVRWSPERGARSLERWRATAREAAKQARRAWVPAVTRPAGTADVATRIAEAACAFLLEVDATDPLARQPVPSSGDVVIVVGPEGGISPAERAAFTAAGARPVRLGPSVLRTSTAGPVAAALLLSSCGRW